MTHEITMMPSESIQTEVAELYKTLGDSTRLRILLALSVQNMNVSAIASTLNMTHSAISHQLRVLNSARLVRHKREGKSMVYSLADDHVKTIIACALEHIEGVGCDEHSHTD